MTANDVAHIRRVIDWLTPAVFDKYAIGVATHSGYLPDKGGLLHEAECEVLDQAVYLQTLREQLLRVEGWLEDGRVEDAMIGLRHILHGTPDDRMPA